MTDLPPTMTVKAGHVQPLWAGHPWVFKQAVQKIDDGVEPGSEVLVLDPHGKILGRALYSPKSAIVARLFTSEGSVPIDDGLFRARIEQAVKLRQAHGLPATELGAETTGFRLIHGEGDRLPGLIVDAFGGVLVVQLGTIGLERRKQIIFDALQGAVSPTVIIDRTPKNIAQQEGFEVEDGPQVVLGEAPDALRFAERGLRFELPLTLAQKTGFYFDQRPLRARVEALARGSRVLDACSYVGPIALSAARGGATEVKAVDTSGPAIEVAQSCAALNGLEVTFEKKEAAHAFREAADDGGYDIVICDPPKMAGRRKARDKALNGYRRLAAGACGATKPGGLLALCSCSGSVDLDALQRVLALGARDAGRRAQIVDRRFQGVDHPVVAAFPEGLYLKVLLARIDQP